ncbi:uncharacterized protein LOC134726694 [Mytilus trossulus]|uniref:uncharacterized protein LOC134726694 n=1 Tax=Mytilus trossulus TaxID=6551 RepID=UPI003006B9C7
MAYSQSIQISQVPVSCGLCEAERPIKWKCLDCSLLMCYYCKEKVHSKFKNAQDHKIIDTKEIGLHCDVLDFKNIKCNEHDGQNCCLFCKTCDNLICPTCVSKFHKKHDLIEIREGYDMKKDKLKKKQANIQKEKFNMVPKIDQMNKLITSEKSKFTKVSQDILTHEKTVRDAVNNYFKGLRNALEQGHKTAVKSIEFDRNAMSISMKLAEDEDNEFREIIQTTDATKFFSDVRLTEKFMTVQAPHIQSSYISTPIFIPGEITWSYVGVIQRDQVLSVNPNVVLHINKQFQTKLGKIIHLSPSPDSSLWISSGNDEDLQKVKLQGNKLRVMSNFSIKVYGMAALQSNDILLSTKESRLKQLNIVTGNLTDSVYDLKHLSPTCIHITTCNEAIVGGNDDILGRSAVFVMNEKGDYENVYENDQHDQPIFNYPRCITSTINGNIHVADFKTNNDRGIVLVLGQGGDIINTYTGHPDVNKDRPMQPIRIVTTPRDNVIVMDLKTCYLHILTNAGRLITLFNTKDLEIEHPLSLAFTSTGQLVIGCTKHISSTTKEAKLYEVGISGC